jgi:Na+-transporting methylmalonyl-CoA/oxaloacetate decarboxylase gamma subunit
MQAREAMIVKACNLNGVGFSVVFLTILIGVIICFAKVLHRLSVGSVQIPTYDS